MKIYTSFVRPAGWTAPYLSAVIWILAAAAVMVAGFLLVSALRLHAENPRTEAQLARLLERKVEKPADMMPHKQLETIRNQVQTLNNLTGTTGHSLAQTLERLERLVPDEVWLVNLQHRPRDGEIRLLAESGSSEHLTNFMERLENARLFAQVLLTRQAQRAESAGRTVQFEIQLREQP